MEVFSARKGEAISKMEIQFRTISALFFVVNFVVHVIKCCSPCHQNSKKAKIDSSTFEFCQPIQLVLFIFIYFYFG